MMPLQNKKLGKSAPKFSVKTLRLPKYTTNLAPAPTACDLTSKITNLGMMENDQLGDCAIASPGHIIQTWTAEVGKQIILPDSAILSAYEAVGGYVPGNESTDNGCNMLDVQNYWRATGIGGHKILAYASLPVQPSQAMQASPAWGKLSGFFKGFTQNVDFWHRVPTVGSVPQWQQQIMNSVYYFGAANIGVQLPSTAQDQQAWEVVSTTGDGAPGSWGGHCVPVVAYSGTNLDDDFAVVVTWGALLKASWRFLQIYMDEAYADFSEDILGADGKTPEGFDANQLNADLPGL